MISLRPNRSTVAELTTELNEVNRNDVNLWEKFEVDSRPFRERIMDLQAELEKLPQIVMPIKHQFCDGLYLRTIWVPAGTLVVTRIYKIEQANIISQGEVSIRSEFGGFRVNGPYIFTAKAGTKRAIYHHTNVMWTSVMPSNSRDIGKNEDRVYASSYEEFDALFPIAEAV